MSATEMSSKRVWVRGRPVRGAIGGFLLGLGLYLLMTRFGLLPLGIMTMVVFVAIVTVLCTARAVLGKPYAVEFDSQRGADMPDPAAAPPQTEATT